MSLPSCPPGSAYAAIELDPTAMVAHLDARALEEAQEIRPRRYLILTSFGLSFPFLGHPWSVYSVWPIGPSLRAVDDKRGLEPDMCVAIFPNEVHLIGRVPVRPTSPFPYDNCYHWAGMKSNLRVHEGEGFRQGAGDPAAGERHGRHDFAVQRGKRALSACEQDAPVPVPADSALPFSPPPSAIERPKDGTTSGEADIFDAPTKDFKDPEFIPLVHLWLDLPANLKQEDIGDPVELYRERFAITSIIRRAHERSPGLPTLREHITLQQDPYIGDSDSDSYMSGTASSYASEMDQSEPLDDCFGKPKRFQPAKLFRKLHTSGCRMFCIPIQP